MSRKTEKLGSLIRNIVGDAILSKISDPRIDPVKTSVTRVEASGDLRHAVVYVSVAGDEKQRSKTMRALSHASGFLQDRIAERAALRHTPILRFKFDEAFKQAIETFRLLSKVEGELRENDEDEASAADINDTAAGDLVADDSGNTEILES